jgi:hypothetical protein
MATEQVRQDNHAAYRRLKPAIDRDYPTGRFIGIHNGTIIGDADTIDELSIAVSEAGQSPGDVLVIQAGVEYLEAGDIFAC